MGSSRLPRLSYLKTQHTVCFEKYLPEEKFLIMDGQLEPQLFSEMKNVYISLLNPEKQPKDCNVGEIASDKTYFSIKLYLLFAESSFFFFFVISRFLYLHPKKQ